MPLRQEARRASPEAIREFDRLFDQALWLPPAIVPYHDEKQDQQPQHSEPDLVGAHRDQSPNLPQTCTGG